MITNIQYNNGTIAVECGGYVTYYSKSDVLEMLEIIEIGEMLEGDEHSCGQDERNNV